MLLGDSEQLEIRRTSRGDSKCAENGWPDMLWIPLRVICSLSSTIHKAYYQCCIGNIYTYTRGTIGQAFSERIIAVIEFIPVHFVGLVWEEEVKWYELCSLGKGSLEYQS